MKRIEGAGWLVLVLALLGVSLGPLRSGSAHADSSAAGGSTTGGAGPGRPEPGAPAPEAVSAPDVPPLPIAAELARALRDAIRERLGRPIEGDTLARVLADLPVEVTLHPIVVHLPDPRQGRHARYFDQGIDALRRGASQHLYNQIGFLLPASAKGEGAADDAVKEPDQYFMLFGRGQSLIVTLLVLESPVQGPKVGDLSTALSIAASMERDGDRFRLLAPFFSGAADAVGVQLERFAREQDAPSAFDVVTGTATRGDINAEVERYPDTWFRRTTPNDEAVLEFLRDELVRRHGTWRDEVLGPLKIALLAEFDTAFGGGIARHTEGETAAAERRPDQDETKLAVFRYPSAISEVRHVRERQEKQHAAADGGDPLSLRRTLQLDVDSAVRDPDIPPLLSPITPFERELELGEQLTGICRERYDYLVLAATDPLDLVYLAEESRKYCPGLPLVALGAEKIFRHPDVRSALDGLLVAGSYPLLNETPPWGNPEERPFSSHVTQGFYNAWLTLLNEALPGPAAPLLDYRALCAAPQGSTEQDHTGDCPSEGGHPLWLTALAGGSFWPLRTGCVESVDAVKQAAAFPETHEETPRARLGGTIRMAGLLLLAIALAQVFWMNRPALLELRRDALGARYRLGMNLTLFLLVLLVMPAMIHAPHDPRGAPWLVSSYGLSIGVAYALLAAMAVHWLGDARRLVQGLTERDYAAWSSDRRAASVSTVALLAFAAAFLALSASWIAQHADLPELDRQMALTRMYNPVGISPLAPVAYLAIAYYVWSFIGLCRVRALIRFSEVAPLPLRGEVHMAGGEPASSGSTLTPALEDVLSNLRGAWSGTYFRYEVLAACFAAVPGAYFCLRVRPTWEPAGYDWLLKLGLAVLYGLVVVASVHFITLVTLLRRFLRQLAALPMVDSYDRVALKMKSSFGIQFGVRVPAFEELQLSGYSSTLLAVLMAAEGPGSQDQSGRSADARSAAEPAAEPTVPNDALGTAVDGSTTKDSHHPESGNVARNQGGEPLPAAYQQVFEKMLVSFGPRSTEVAQALKAFRHAEGQAVEIEERGHRALYQASQTLFVTLRKLWALRARLPITDKLNQIDPKALLSGGDLAELPTVSLYAGAVPPRVLLWMRVAEDFVTLRIATFLSHVMTHLRYLLAFTLSASLLLILAVSSYPLEPTRFVTVFSWTLMLGVIALAFVVIVRMERNEVLSRLSGSTPGKIDFNFALAGQLVVYVGLPLLAVLANIFPEIRDQLFAWVGPVKRLLP